MVLHLFADYLSRLPELALTEGEGIVTIPPCNLQLFPPHQHITHIDNKHNGLELVLGRGVPMLWSVCQVIQEVFSGARIEACTIWGR